MRIVSVVIAIAAGLIVLSGYFIQVDYLLNTRIVLLQWAIILAAVAVIVGVFNLLSVHWQKVQNRKKGNTYSILLLVSLFATFVLGLIPPGPDSAPMQFALNAIIVPAEAALMALLAITLLYASTRLLGRRIDLMTILFLGTAIVILLATVPLPFGKIPGLSDFILPWIRQVFAAAGARGILIGVALGALTTGLRALFGIDRPYGGN
jgi:hypothetical protein